MDSQKEPRILEEFGVLLSGEDSHSTFFTRQDESRCGIDPDPEKQSPY